MTPWACTIIMVMLYLVRILLNNGVWCVGVHRKLHKSDNWEQETFWCNVSCSSNPSSISLYLIFRIAFIEFSPRIINWKTISSILIWVKSRYCLLCMDLILHPYSDFTRKEIKIVEFHCYCMLPSLLWNHSNRYRFVNVIYDFVYDITLWKNKNLWEKRCKSIASRVA